MVGGERWVSMFNVGDSGLSLSDVRDVRCDGERHWQPILSRFEDASHTKRLHRYEELVEKVL